MAINLEVYDVLGRKIQTLLQNEFYGVGAHSIHFDAKGLSSGLYYYRLQTGQTEIIRSMTLIK